MKIDEAMRVLPKHDRWWKMVKNNCSFVVQDQLEGRRFLPLNWLARLHLGIGGMEATKHEATPAMIKNTEGVLEDHGYVAISATENPEDFELLFEEYLETVRRDFPSIKRDWEPRRRNLHKQSPGKWRFFVVPPGNSNTAMTPEEALNDPDFEGASLQVTTNRYERKGKLRNACIKYYRSMNGDKLFCQACDFDFEAAYGKVGSDFIHIHHKHPLGDKQSEHEVDPIRHLVPVCPNCHAMIHRGGKNRSISEIRNLLGKG